MTIRASLSTVGILWLLTASAANAAPASLHYREEADGQPIGESGNSTVARGTHFMTSTWYHAHVDTPVPIDFDVRETYDESLDGQLIRMQSESRENKLLTRADITVGADRLLHIRYIPGHALKPTPLDTNVPLLGPQGVRQVIARWLKNPSAPLAYVTIHSLLLPVHVSLEDLGPGSVPGSRLVRETWQENAQVWEKVVDADGITLEEKTDGPGGHIVTRLVP